MDFQIAGNVRAQEIIFNYKKKLIFKEKGVDVKIAVDLVSLAYRHRLDIAYILSSDSDLQPAISELKKLNVNIIYIAVENEINLGMKYTADQTIILSQTDILRCVSYISYD